MQALNLVAAAPNINVDAGTGAGALRGKRKNAGVNRRYSEEEYVVDDVEEEGSARQKRRRTAQAPGEPAHGRPTSSHLLDAADACRDQDFPSIAKNVPNPVNNVATAPNLARLAAVAVSINIDGAELEVEDRNIDHLDSAMELD